MQIDYKKFPKIVLIILLLLTSKMGELAKAVEVKSFNQLCLIQNNHSKSNTVLCSLHGLTITFVGYFHSLLSNIAHNMDCLFL